MEILYNPYSYEEMTAQMDEKGEVIGYVQVDSSFVSALEEAAQKESAGDIDESAAVYEQLAEMVIGSQWCYLSLYWEIVDDSGDNVVIKVIVCPDLSD